MNLKTWIVDKYVINSAIMESSFRWLPTMFHNLTAEERQARLEMIAGYDLTVIELARKSQLKEWARGLVRGFHRLNKSQLIAALNDATADLREAKRLEIERERLEQLERENRLAAERAKLDLAAAEIPNIEQRRLMNRKAVDPESPESTAERLYAQVKDILSRVDTLEQQKEDITDLVLQWNNQVRDYSPVTVAKTHAPRIIKRLTELIEFEPDSNFKSELVILVASLKSKINKAVESINIQQNREYKTKVASQVKNLVPVKLEDLLVLCEEFLRDPDTHGWKKVSCALALVTGRRMAEIHCTAEFNPVDDYSVEFSGQLKTKGREDGTQSYEIPVLVNSGLIVDALQWLGRMQTERGKPGRIDDVRLVNKLYSKELSREMEVGPFHIEAGEGSHLPYKALRALYAEICYQQYCDPNLVTRSGYFSRILGHSDNDVDTSHSYQVYSLLMD